MTTATRSTRRKASTKDRETPVFRLTTRTARYSIPCTVCGQVMLAARSDALTCSAPCRKKLSRMSAEDKEMMRDLTRRATNAA